MARSLYRCDTFSVRQRSRQSRPQPLSCGPPITPFSGASANFEASHYSIRLTPTTAPLEWRLPGSGTIDGWQRLRRHHRLRSSMPHPSCCSCVGLLALDDFRDRALTPCLGKCASQAQAGATPATSDNGVSAHSSTASELNGAAAQTPTVDDVCRALEQSAAENALPVEFFARVIWQESRFDAQAVSPKGAAGIAQFMPATASWHGLADPFDPVEALRHSAAYLRELLTGLVILDLPQRRTMQVQAESAPG